VALKGLDNERGEKYLGLIDLGLPAMPSPQSMASAKLGSQACAGTGEDAKPQDRGWEVRHKLGAGAGGARAVGEFGP
jgi:hypothetical protein